MPKSFLDVEWDGREVGRLLQKKALRYNTDISELMKDEMRTMANTAAKTLPPFDKKNFSNPSYTGGLKTGHRRVRQGYGRTFPSAFGEKIEGGDTAGAYKGIAQTAGEDVARLFYYIHAKSGEKKALEFLRTRGVPVDVPSKSRHDAIRVGRTKGHPGRSDFIAVSPKGKRASVIRRSKDRVGRLKATYSIAASQLGLGGRSIPKWVSRHHSRNEGKVDVSQLYRPWRQQIAAIPYAKYAPPGSKRLVDLGLRIRQKNLRNEVFKGERKAKGYFNRR